MTKFLLVFLGFGVVSGSIGQNAIDLTFAAVDSAPYVQLNSIKVMNRTQGCDTVLYWPDTVLSIYYVNTSEISDFTGGFQLFKNHPNPVASQTNISLYVPEKNKVCIIVTDILGRVVSYMKRLSQKSSIVDFQRFLPLIPEGKALKIKPHFRVEVSLIFKIRYLLELLRHPLSVHSWQHESLFHHCHLAGTEQQY